MPNHMSKFSGRNILESLLLKVVPPPQAGSINKDKLIPTMLLSDTVLKWKSTGKLAHGQHQSDIANNLYKNKDLWRTQIAVFAILILFNFLFILINSK